ncbi:hypothetical protein DEO72_LG9g1526 [Vigna unguiculata]|uniref:Uncharacterized protein n=1 Tax=Vigna unguiculata TaxID=3917 RepID=A0A4D6N2F4_VIGUN|nr:hypothetical protein DEO72_LG9g1188 [Vigna unguiculata]QCE06513.1 hypothetical protein DEO72_LG9g1526 [Vigna unguiculata]
MRADDAANDIIEKCSKQHHWERLMTATLVEATTTRNEGRVDCLRMKGDDERNMDWLRKKVDEKEK